MKRKRKRRKRRNSNFFTSHKNRIPLCLLAFVLFFTFSCKEKNKEVIHLNLKKSLSENKEKNKQIDAVTPLRINYFDDSSPFDSNSIVSIDSTSFIVDRFTSLGSSKFNIKNNINNISYYSWEFPDSSSLMNALYNWLDCYGTKCNSVKMYDTTIVMDKKPFLIFAGNSSLIYIKSNNNLKYERWLNFFNYKFPSEKWIFLIEQKKKTKVAWYTMDDLQFLTTGIRIK